MAGPEIAVATTKGYSTQLAVIYLIALKFAAIRQTLKPARIQELTQALIDLPDQIEALTKMDQRLLEMAT